MNIPKHVAIIPDGNRRWAKSQELPEWQGHVEGGKRAEEVLRAALKAGVQVLSMWGSSLKNIVERPKQEVEALQNIYKEKFTILAEDEFVHENKVKLVVSGAWRRCLRDDVCEAIEQALTATAHHNNFTLNTLLAYDGREEMVQAVKNIIASGIKGVNVNEQVIKDNLYSVDLPPVDLIIRTGSSADPHMSAGFMMWETADSQLYFSEKFWPDFDNDELQKALDNYAERERRLGK